MSPDPTADALELQREAAATGFDWNHADELWDKLDEEIRELRESTTQGQDRVVDEFGDLLFVVLNLSRHMKVDAVQALAQANEKFRRRFAVVMAGRAKWDALNGPARTAQMEQLWQEAKQRGL